ncbi:MAG: metallophosphoesterase, partial [Clostridia bacterium]|nr:metallophosphoesterase [Clostridia bacterium]
DGNHENFNELYKYPLVDKFGGKAHKIRENIYHLERGYVFEIQGKTFFTFGGAYSVDRGSRIKGYSWWHQEKPSKEEYQRGKTALESVKRVDYIITHTAPFCAVDKLKYLIPYSERKDFYIDLHDYDLLSYFEELTTLFEFGHWYFGHWHKDKKIDERFTAVYEKVYAIKGEKE